MNEKITDAIVLRSQDFKDNDKIVYLFSPAEGKISAVLKGVKKASAKLKFAGEPFCFAEYTYVRRGDMATITNAMEKESFFDIRKDITSFYCGMAVLEITSAFATENEANPSLFINVIRALRLIDEGKVSPKLVLARFVLDVFDNFGQKPSFDLCAECGDKVGAKAKFDFASGGVLCKNCANAFADEIDDAVCKVLSIVDGFAGDKIYTYKCSDVLLDKTLAFLSDIFAKHFKKINSLCQLLEL